MGIAAPVFWLIIVLFLFPFAYVLFRQFKSKAEQRERLNEIRQKLAAKQGLKDRTDSHSSSCTDDKDT